jgi:hypothetical protein
LGEASTPSGRSIGGPQPGNFTAKIAKTGQPSSIQKIVKIEILRAVYPIDSPSAVCIREIPLRSLRALRLKCTYQAQGTLRDDPLVPAQPESHPLRGSPSFNPLAPNEKIAMDFLLVAVG